MDHADNRNNNRINRNLYDLSSLFLLNCIANGYKPRTVIVYCDTCASYVVGNYDRISYSQLGCIFCGKRCRREMEIQPRQSFTE